MMLGLKHEALKAAIVAAHGATSADVAACVQREVRYVAPQLGRLRSKGIIQRDDTGAWYARQRDAFEGVNP